MVAGGSLSKRVADGIAVLVAGIELIKGILDAVVQAKRQGSQTCTFVHDVVIVIVFLSQQSKLSSQVSSMKLRR